VAGVGATLGNPPHPPYDHMRRLRTLGLLCGLLAAITPSSASPQERRRSADPGVDPGFFHYQRGVASFRDGRYDEAVREFEAARRLKPGPNLDYNIARCRERLGHWQLAIDSYERYLAATPGAPDAAEVRARVAAIRQRLWAGPGPAPTGQPGGIVSVPAAAASAPTGGSDGGGRAISVPAGGEPPTAPAPPRSTARRWLAWGSGGLAVATAVAGTVLVTLVAPDFEAKQDACRLHQCTSADWRRLETRANAGYALWGVAGALVVVDVILWVLELRRRPAERRAWRAPRGPGLAAGGSF
jgi:hypothetical protein